jgi:glutamate/tyrosine decarboxylase-like PLP-dependent enzyme
VDAHLHLSGDEIRRLGHRIVDAIADHWERLPELPPVVTGDPDALARRLGGPPPDAPGDVDAALDVLLAHVVPSVQHGDHPRFFARVGSPSNPVSALADALATGTNLIATSWTGGSGPTAVEVVVLDWIRSWCGLPEETEGILVSGGSVGSLTALAAAREARPGRTAAVVSDQTHASVLRGLRLLGLRDVRVLETDEGFRLRAADVERELGRGDVAVVVGTAGTTNTGAIDPLDALATVCAEHGAWLHVDAAYGGPAVLTETGRAALRGIERADSLVLDPHKWLFQPYEAGCVLVREPGALARAFSMLPEYLLDTAGAGEVNFRDRGPQLSRGARALKLWLSVQAFGLDAFRAAVARGIENAERAQAAIERTPGLEIVTPAQLGIVTFRHARADAHELVDRVVADGFAAPSSTVLRGESVLRLCMINPRTTDADIDATVERIAALAG